MNYRWLGRTGLRISVLGLGSSPFGGGMGSISGVGASGADEIVGRALDAGINYFDTADVYSYGEAEERLGRALGSRRDDVVLATKCGFRVNAAPNHAGASRTHLVRQLEGSLRRLGTDHVDVFYIHVYDERTDLDDVMVTLDALVRAGKVRYAGASNFPAWRVAHANARATCVGHIAFGVYQGLWNVLARDVEDEIAPMCQSLGLGYLAWSPLGGGLLTGKYGRNEPPPEGSRFADPESPESRFLGHDWERAHDVVDVLRAIAESRGATVSQVALAWVLARPGVSAAVVGARTVAQLEDNLGAAGLELDTCEVGRIDAAAPAPRRWPAWQIEGNRESRVAWLPH